MEKQRQVKILSIVALVLAISAMTLGFAAFSTTLSISSSATVTPNSDDFRLEILPISGNISDSLAPEIVGSDITATNAKISGMSLSDIKISFSEPGQSVTYFMFVSNTGKYTTYLNSVNFGNKQCNAAEGTTSNLVSMACQGISRNLVIQSPTKTISLDKSSKISMIEFAPGEKLILEYIIQYTGEYRADGPFDVTFSDLSLDFSTVDNNESANLISFTIDGKPFQAEEGMTWGEWIDSQYSEGLFTTYSGTFIESLGGYSLKNSEYVNLTVDVNIIDGAKYYCVI